MKSRVACLLPEANAGSQTEQPATADAPPAESLAQDRRADPLSTPPGNVDLVQYPVYIGSHRRFDLATERRAKDFRTDLVHAEIGCQEGDVPALSTEQRHKARLARAGQPHDRGTRTEDEPFHLRVGGFHGFRFQAQALDAHFDPPCQRFGIAIAQCQWRIGDPTGSRGKPAPTRQGVDRLAQIWKWPTRMVQRMGHRLL